MPKAGYVYLMQDGFNQHKIGVTTRSVEQRLKELNGKQASSPIELVGYIEVSDIHSVEKLLHEKFAAYRTHGEWFNFRGNLDAVEQMYDRLEAQYPANKKTQDDDLQIDWSLIDWDSLELADDQYQDDPWEKPIYQTDNSFPVAGAIGLFALALLFMHLAFNSRQFLRTAVKANVVDSVNGQVICEVPANTKLPLLERGEWSEVEACGKTGFIHKSAVE